MQNKKINKFNSIKVEIKFFPEEEKNLDISDNQDNIDNGHRIRIKDTLFL